MMASKCESAGDLGFDATFPCCFSVNQGLQFEKKKKYGRNTMKQEPKPSNSDHVSIN
jgi:hypothetical protein